MNIRALNPSLCLLATVLLLLGIASPNAFAAAPSITTQPPSTQSLLAGSNATFTVVATGSTPLSYQWSLGGVNLTNSLHIGGATNAQLTVTNLVAADAGNYQVVVTNAHGSITSSNALLIVLFPASITAGPTNQSVFVGSNITFSATTSGTAPLFYQWQKNNTNLANTGIVTGANTNTLNLSGVQTNDSGSYRLIVTNNYGSATSAVATLTVSVHPSVTHYVNLAGSNPLTPYTTWSTAATNIQDAVDAANGGDTILVTNGTYTAGNRVVGSVTNRVVVTVPLQLTSVNGPATTIIDGGGAACCLYLTNGCVLSGFTITNGTSPQTGNGGSGGGIYCTSTNTLITNCVITGNAVPIQGGGIYQGTLINCLLTGNTCAGNAAGYPGGGAASSSLLEHCLLTDNSSTSYGMGGALYNCIANHCVLTNNSASLSQAGGASHSTLNNCLIVANYAGSSGGGADSCTLNNCTIVNNTANLGGGGGASSSTVNNCIVYYNAFIYATGFGYTPDQTNCANCTVSNSCVQPLMTNGTANISAPPIFIDPNSDWHLQSNSPCINAGNNSYTSSGTDLDGNPRLIGPIVDIGAYEYQPPTIAITAQPSSLAVLTTSNAQFSVAAISPFVLGYQWYFNGASLTDGGRISGSTTANLTILNAQPGDYGQYQVLITNQSLSATSTVATLTVLIPASITQSPTNQAVVLSNNVSFMASATGTAPLAAQWYFNGTPLTDGGRISGSTTTNLNISNVQASDAGPYQLMVTNNYGQATSTVANLTVLIPAKITQQPSALTTFVLSNAYFTVADLGTAPLHAQWYFNGTPLTDGGRIAGSATTNLTITGVQTNDAGSYQFVVTNNYGSDTSIAAALNVIAAPVFLKPPTNQVAMIYSNVTLSVTITDAPPVYIQWQKNGVNLTDGGSLSGTATANLTIANPQFSDAGQYTVTASNTWGSVTGTETLTVSPVLSWGVAVTVPPASVTNIMAIASAGTVLAADFAVRTDGSVIGWGSDFYGILDIPANATNLLTITAGPEEAIGIRPDGSVVTWGYGGSVVPDNVTNVAAAAVESYGGCLALRQDGSVVAWNGTPTPPANVTNVIAIGAGFYHCLAVLQNGTIVGWGDNSSGEISVPAQATNVIAVGGGSQGAYTYSLALRTDGNVVGFGFAPGVPSSATNCVAIAPGNSHWLGLFQNGIATSFGLAGLSPSNCLAIASSGEGYHDTALVQDPNLALPPRLLQQPLGAIEQVGQNIILLSRALGSQPMQFQWSCNGTPLAGQTNNWLLLSALQPGQGGSYQVVVTNNFGSVTSTPAIISISPIISAQPSAAVVYGSNAVFSVTADGTPPFAYQWYSNNVPLTDGGRISGSTTTNLTIANFGSSDTANYTVVISNAGGSITSAPAVITVLNPVITAQPSNQTVLGGGRTSFSISANGQTPFTYQWLYNGAALSGATNNPLLLTNLLVSQSGSYSVIVSSLYGFALSSNATLTVTALSITTQPTNRVAWLGSSAAFRVNVTGTPPFTFEWQCNNVDVPGVYSNILILTNLQANQFGTYSVIVGNSYGTVTSTNAILFPSQVAVWGGVNGETNLAPGLTNVIAVSGGQSGSSDCLALLGNNSVLQWPFIPSPYVLAPLTNIVAIAAGGGNAYNLALRPNGTVLSWLYDPPLAVIGLTNIAAITPQNNGRFALLTNGTVYFSNPAGPGTPPFVTNLTNVVAIGAGYVHDLVLKADGTVFAWGNDVYFQTNVPPGLSNVIAIAAGGYHNLALKSDHTIVAWGRNLEHQTNVPPGLSNVVAIAAGGYHSLALKTDGTVIAWGQNIYNQTNVPPSVTNVVAIAAGQYHSLAILGNGPPAPQTFATNPGFGTNNFTLSVPSQSGHVYFLQYKTSISDSNWISLPLVPGNGGNLQLTDPTPTNTQRFYRVQQW